jgi:hypothetical protein
MCYKAAIASSGGDDATLAKLLITSLEGASKNWYSRLAPRCIIHLAVVQGEVPAKLTRVSSGAQYRG